MRLSKKAATKQETLTYMVAQRTSELQETNRQLRDEIQTREQLEKQLLRAQKMEAIGTLAAGVAHDLNNILTGIVSYPDLLLMQVDPQNPMHRQLKLIQKSGVKAAAIVQDMLTLGRRVVINLEQVDLKSVIEEYLQSLEYSSFKRHCAGRLCGHERCRHRDGYHRKRPGAYLRTLLHQEKNGLQRHRPRAGGGLGSGEGPQGFYRCNQQEK